MGAVKIVNPYHELKPYPYKISLHNHTQFTPSHIHAPVFAKERLEQYRDYETDPPYGVVVITDHDRLSTPWNTIPPCEDGIYDYSMADPPWGVSGVLWIPGMERKIGRPDGSDQQFFGEVVCINSRPELMETETKWTRTKSDKDRSGWFYQTRLAPASAELTFVGTGVRWIARTHDGGGIAKVLVDGVEVGLVDLYSETTEYKQVVFEQNGLSNGLHTIRIVQTEEKNPSSMRRYAQNITLDTFVVIKSDGSQLDYGADHAEIRYSPLRHRYDRHPDEKARDVVAQLHQDGVYMIMSHPNAHLEKEGEFAGTQVWSSMGFTYGELDTMFGKEGVNEAWPRLPHALEIGNAGYDFNERTNWTNAEAKWDYLLSQGHRIHGTASDDSHGNARMAGWSVIYTDAPNREALRLTDVMDSLFKGTFYSSQGPAITSIRVENNQFIIETDTPSLIEFVSRGEIVGSERDVRSLSYSIRGDEGYVRARVTRSDPGWPEIGGGIGKVRSAWTNPIYVVRDRKD